MNTEKILLDSNFQEYLSLLGQIKIPKTCFVQDYKQSETIRRKTIKYYTECIKRYPLRNIGKNEDRVLNTPKTDTIEMKLSYLNPLIICASESATELSIAANDDSMALQYLLQLIIVDKMAEDFNDSTIEKALLWYSMNYRKQDLRNIQRYQNGIVNSINKYAVERIVDFALASTMYEKYKKARPRVLSDIRRMIVDKKGIDILLQNYNVSLSNPEIIETLEKQEKILTLKKPN